MDKIKSLYKFAFFGTGDFAVKILDILLQDNYIPEIIITTPDKPKGRKMELTPSPVKNWVQKNNIKTITDYSLLVTHYDLFIVADYGKILPKEIINMPKHKTLNVHPSILPKFRGPSPIQSFILSKDEETGITIILMDEEVDHGPIIAQQTWTSDVRLDIGCPSYKELEKKLAKLGGKMLVETIPDWINGKIKTREQNHGEATFTKKIIKENGLINPDDSPELIMKKILALTPWPSAYFFAEKDGRKMRIIITDAEIKENKLIIKKIKPEGKKEIPLDDFYKEIIGRYLKMDQI
mgnify:CR=1 FL=1